MFGQKPKAVNRVVLLPTSAIRPNPMQPRTVFDPQQLNELAESIAQNGLLQPIVVRHTGQQQYELIAGERRLKACRLLAMENIPAIIEERSGEDAALLALIENLQRTNLNFFEEARALQRLQEQLQVSQSQLARRLGRTQSAIANKIRLLRYEEPEQALFLQNGLTERHARALLPLIGSRSSLYEALQMVINQGLTVAQTEQIVKKILEKTSPKPTRMLVVKDVRLFVNTINKAITTMQATGIEAKSQKSEDEEFICFEIKIPKKAVYRTKSTA